MRRRGRCVFGGNNNSSGPGEGVCSRSETITVYALNGASKDLMLEKHEWGEKRDQGTGHGKAGGEA